MSPIEDIAGGARLHIRVQPRASRTEVAGLHGDAIKLRVAAPPVEGAANEKVIRFLADVLDVGRQQITIASGLAGRKKTVHVSGIDAATARDRLGL